MTRIRIGLALTLIALSSGLGERAIAQTPSSANTLKLDGKESVPAASIEDVSWVAGHWTGQALGGIAEEVWSPPLGNGMMGMFKLVKGGEVAFYELLTIVEENGSLVLKLKHFDADLAGWEERASPWTSRSSSGRQPKSSSTA